MLEHYISVGQQRMRCGYTTGTCAAGAARAAAEALLRGSFPAQVLVETPAGIPAGVSTKTCAGKLPRSKASAAARAAPAAQVPVV